MAIEGCPSSAQFCEFYAVFVLGGLEDSDLHWCMFNKFILILFAHYEFHFVFVLAYFEL